MDLTSLFFLSFVLISCIIYYIVPRKAQWIVLLVSSLVFYALSSGRLIFYLLVVTAIVYIGALWLDFNERSFRGREAGLEKAARKEARKQHKKAQKVKVVFLSIAALGSLVVLKYSALGVEVASFALDLFGASNSIAYTRFALPLGISYFSLMAISYLIDVYRGKVSVEKNPFRVLLFTCYYPHITEGPFDRFHDLSDQFSSVHTFDFDLFCNGWILILFGYFKKIVIADRLGITVSEIFHHVDDYSGSAIALASILYTFQLYCDFSGCIDLVSGVSELYGIKLAENFRQPFFSRSINEFWRRWHITLGLWLKEYVYYPVVLSGHFKAVDKYARKHLKSQNLINLVPSAYALFFVWFTNGLWHGASVHYIAYGLYYYLLMMLGELLKPLALKADEKLHFLGNRFYSLFQVLRTFLIVNTGMLLFRSTSVGEFFSLLQKSWSSFHYFVGMKEIFFFSREIVFALLALLVLLVVSFVREKVAPVSVRDLLSKKPVLRYLLILALVTYILTFGIYGPGFDSADFVYAQF